MRFRNFVGILSARRVASDESPVDPVAFPRGAIVGAIQVSNCISIDSHPEKFLSAHFGRGIADAYPSKYIPRQSPTFVWVLARTLVASAPHDWQGLRAIRWASSPVELGGNVVRFVHHPLMDLPDGAKVPA